MKRQHEKSCFEIRGPQDSRCIKTAYTMKTVCLAYEKFEKFRRPETMSITDYIVEFERLYYKIKTHKMVLPDDVLAYRVL